MNDTQLTVFLPILLGTRRTDRQSARVAQLIHSRAQEHSGIETELFDVRDFAFPNDDEGQNLKKLAGRNSQWRDAIIRADGLMIVVPEYNHGYPGSLKTVLDMLLKEYIHKVVGLVGVSAGMFGGARVIEQLVGVVRELGLVVTFADLYFPKVGQAFDDKGQPTDPKVLGRIDTFFEELVWMAQTLRWGREHLPSKFHELPQPITHEGCCAPAEQ